MNDEVLTAIIDESGSLQPWFESPNCKHAYKNNEQLISLSRSHLNALEKVEFPVGSRRRTQTFDPIIMRQLNEGLFHHILNSGQGRDGESRADAAGLGLDASSELQC
jgi:hypothetical protein